MPRVYRVFGTACQWHDRPVAATSPNNVLGLTGVVDLVTGLVLSVAGVVTDTQVLAIIGVVLLISGGGMLAFVVWRRSQPELL